MSSRKPLIVLVLTGLLLVSIAMPVTAHEAQTVEGYEITFGGAQEPLITGERMWLEFEIVTNETGEPVTNQSENLTASVQIEGGEKTALDLSEKHGEPGVYEAPVIFTKAGNYTVHLEGSIEDTAVHTHFEKQVHDRTELMYPRGETQANTSEDPQDTTSQSEEAGFGLGTSVIGILAVVAVVGAYVARQRR